MVTMLSGLKRNGRPRPVPWIVLLAALWLCAPVRADVTVTLDRDRIVEGETVTLVVQTNDPQQSLDPNLAELQEDFVVLDRRTETQMSIVNGRQSAVMKLLLTLEPKRAGSLTIPPLRFGNVATPARTLQVDPAPEPEPGALPPVFIDVELDPAEGPHYVHAQLRLTVRVHYLPNLAEAAITPPEPSPASVRLLDEVPYQAERGGVRYRVLERHYAVFPERSGPLEIPAMRLTGRLVERRSDQLWQPAVKGRRIQASSEPLQLDILPRPDTYVGDSWQPARALEASQNISSSETLSVGEPVTRTVIIDAIGLEENMIPEPGQPDIPGARIYPDQPQGITRDDGKWVLGHKEFRYAIVPENPGELVLPELTVHWWDTVNDRQAEAVLPEVRLEVLPSTLPTAATPAAPSAASAPAGPALPGAVNVSSGRNYWVGLSALFALLWLVTLGLYLRRPRPAGRPDSTASEPAGDEKALLDRLQRACRADDAAQARQVLGQWLRRYGPGRYRGSIRALAGELEGQATGGGARDTHPELGAELVRLDAAGFQPAGVAGGAPGWDGAALWNGFSKWRAEQLRPERTMRDPMDLYGAGGQARV
ncbi:BatD family protein [Elongatibacter sediminis]|uniref:BatD family protein n=1 Tax=Elongatibacter sediminis TaxID=3119006 RepID=A0AAW9RDP6_9GAMM